jgi:synapsin
MAKKKTLLVVECTETFNWHEIFAGVKLFRGTENETEIVVEQAAFPDISLTSYSSSGAVVNIRRAKRPLANTSQCRDRTVRVDFVLLRSVTKGISNQDSRNVLMAFIHAGLPSVNSLHSAYMALSRPVMWGELRRIQREAGGRDAFPLVAQDMYASHLEMRITPEFPFVVKVGSAHAGYGKMKVCDSTQFEDVRSICALHSDFVTCEPFVDADWDARVQKIGPHVRAFRRTSQNWKMNTGHGSIVEQIECPDEWRRWAELSATACGGLDILGLDLIHDRNTGRIQILELNDTAIGLVHKVEDEDNGYIRDLVLAKMELAFASDGAAAASSSTAAASSSSSPSSSNATMDARQFEITLEHSRQESSQLRSLLVAAEAENELIALQAHVAKVSALAALATLVAVATAASFFVLKKNKQ